MRSTRVFLVFVTVLLALSIDAFAITNFRVRANINPTCTSSQGASLKFADIYADGNIAVMGSYGCKGVFIFDISNPDAPVLASWYNPGANIQFLEAIVIGNRGYFGAGNNPVGNPGGVHIVDLTNPANPQLLGIVNANNGGGHNTIHEMMVFDQNGARYLLENSNSTATRQLRIINVTNPASAVLKWNFLSTDGGWVHAMHIRGDRMYLSGFSSSTRVDIYDISNLATQAPSVLGSVAVGLGANHSAWTSEDGNYLYSAREISNSDATNPGDIRVYDVSIPSQPMLVNRFTMSDLGIVGVTPHNPVVMGNKLYVAWYQAGTQVFDISVPASPVRIGQYDTWPAQFTEEDLRSIEKFEPGEVICGANQLTGAMITGYNGNWAVFPFLGENKVLLGDLATGLYIIDVTEPNPVSDFDGDGKTDLSVFTPSTGNWLVERSSSGSQQNLQWGIAEDILAAGDYDGDGRSDHAIFRPSTGTWWLVLSSNGSRPAIRFGLAGDIPVAADYDADGKTDVAVWRPSTGIWYILQSTLGFRAVHWGLADDKPLVGDYDGDGKPDIAVWRPSNGVWYVFRSSTSTPMYVAWGLEGDKPLMADFDGDARSDFAVFRPSTGIWYVLTAGGAFSAYHFGQDEDVPIPADYDGDGKADIALFRPSTNVWYRLNSTDGSFFARVFGQDGDRVSPASVQPQ